MTDIPVYNLEGSPPGAKVEIVRCVRDGRYYIVCYANHFVADISQATNLSILLEGYEMYLTVDWGKVKAICPELWGE